MSKWWTFRAKLHLPARQCRQRYRVKQTLSTSRFVYPGSDNNILTAVIDQLDMPNKADGKIYHRIIESFYNLERRHVAKLSQCSPLHCSLNILFHPLISHSLELSNKSTTDSTKSRDHKNAFIAKCALIIFNDC